MVYVKKAKTKTTAATSSATTKLWIISKWLPAKQKNISIGFLPKV